jgi:hypothetical protein
MPHPFHDDFPQTKRHSSVSVLLASTEYDRISFLRTLHEIRHAVAMRWNVKPEDGYLGITVTASTTCWNNNNKKLRILSKTAKLWLA